MRIEVVPIDSVTLDPANVRKHNSRSIETIKGSLSRFNQQKPIVVDCKGVVRAGNGTLVAARELGWTEIRIVRSDLTGVELAAYSLVDNRSSELSEWDDDALALTLRALQDEDFDLDAVGFTDAEVDALFGNGAGDDVGEEKAEKQEPWQGRFELVIEFGSEAEQQAAYEKLTAEGYTCRVLTM